MDPLQRSELEDRSPRRRHRRWSVVGPRAWSAAFRRRFGPGRPTGRGSRGLRGPARRCRRASISPDQAALPGAASSVGLTGGALTRPDAHGGTSTLRRGTCGRGIRSKSCLSGVRHPPPGLGMACASSRPSRSLRAGRPGNVGFLGPSSVTFAPSFPALDLPPPGACAPSCLSWGFQRRPSTVPCRGVHSRLARHRARPLHPVLSDGRVPALPSGLGKPLPDPRSALEVLHLPGGLLLPDGAGLLHPAPGPGVRRVST